VQACFVFGGTLGPARQPHLEKKRKGEKKGKKKKELSAVGS
jgi:hypothetical protein